MSRPEPKVAAVIGWPIQHSKSPLIHRFWMQHLGLDGDYSRLPVAPEHLETAIRALPALGLRGVNVTVPHKVAVMDFLDRIDASAQSIGAVNTVVVAADGALEGYNTDRGGFLEPIRARIAVVSHAVVLGAGGAARAVVAGLEHSGVRRITLMARDETAAQQLFGAHAQFQFLPFGADLPADCDLLVNATSLGMDGKPPLDVDPGGLPVQACVYDLVYAPLETGLLRRARARGLEAVDGLGMLIGQAAEAFELFFAVSPPRSDALDAQLRALLVGA